MITIDKLLFYVNDKIEFYNQYNYLPAAMKGMLMAFEHCKSYIEFLNALDNDKPLPTSDYDKIYALKSDILFKLQYYIIQDDINDLDLGIIIAFREFLSFIIKHS